MFNTNFLIPGADASYLRGDEERSSASGSYFFMEYWKIFSIEDLSGEIWFDIPGYEYFYQLSNFKRIKSKKRLVRYPDGRPPYWRPPQIMVMHFTKIRRYKTKPYLFITLTGSDFKKTEYLHRIIAKVHVPNPNNYPHVNHIDGNTLNNEPYNLEWCTNRYNIQHAHDNGFINTAYGEKSSKAKLTNDQVLDIALTTGKAAKVAKEYGVTKCTIEAIWSGRYWGTITGTVFKSKSKYNLK